MKIALAGITRLESIKNLLVVLFSAMSILPIALTWIIVNARLGAIESVSIEESQRLAYADLDHILDSVEAMAGLVGSAKAGGPDPAALAAIKAAITDVKVGATGYVYVLDRDGRYVISRGGKRDGELIIDSVDASGNHFVREIIGKALGLKPGEIAEERYSWRNPEDPAPRMKIARIGYLSQWGWIVGVGSYLDEFMTAPIAISRIKGSNQKAISLTLGISAIFAVAMIVLFNYASRTVQSAIATRVKVDWLEREVGERTRQLEESNQQLSEEIVERKRSEEALRVSYADLKNLQTQLIQSEKMASVGQLAAGVAHEINNPAGFVISDLGTLQSYITDLLGMFELYRNLDAQLKVELTDRAERLLAEVDHFSIERRIPDILQDLPGITGEMLDGMNRIKRIVMDLRSFAHSDDGRWEVVDIRDALEMALSIASNEIKYKAEVIREYGDVPRVRCLPQQLSQVFLNLLINAAQAISEKGTITVRTMLEGGRVVVEVEDTGCGMSEEVRKRVFEPFFTTKPVGQGTGLGLSLAYNIIESHEGEITVASQPGKGSTFRISLPVAA